MKNLTFESKFYIQAIELFYFKSNGFKYCKWMVRVTIFTLKET